MGHYRPIGGNPDHVTLGLGLRLGGVGLPLYCAWRICVTRYSFNSNNFASSAAMAEECALRSAILVYFCSGLEMSRQLVTAKMSSAMFLA